MQVSLLVTVTVGTLPRPTPLTPVLASLRAAELSFTLLASLRLQCIVPAEHSSLRLSEEPAKIRSSQQASRMWHTWGECLAL